MDKKSIANFEGHYLKWRETRINKIIKLSGGEDKFKDMTVLELGCGYGDIGMHFSKLGANVTLAEGREEHVRLLKQRYTDAKVLRIDQDHEWDVDETFDVIIHMGVLYHLFNWEDEIRRVLTKGKIIFLETEVANRSSDSFDMVVEEDKKRYDSSLHGPSKRASAAYIEKILKDCGASFQRYDDSDLNAAGHKYDWVVDDNGAAWTAAANRRFWKIVV